MNIEVMKQKLQKTLKPERYEHSVRVYETAVKMADWYGLNKEKIAVAALLHDCGRVVSSDGSVTLCESLGLPVDAVSRRQPVLLHQVLGRYYAKADYGVEDEDILQAIACHTTGGLGMGAAAKVVYVADLIEPGRDFEGVVELRQAAKQGLNAGMKACYINTIKYLLVHGLLIHSDCIDGYNELLMQEEKKRWIPK